MERIPLDIQKVIFTIANNTCKKDGCNKEKRRSIYPLCPECHIEWLNYKYGSNKLNFEWNSKDKERHIEWFEKRKIGYLFI